MAPSVEETHGFRILVQGLLQVSIEEIHDQQNSQGRLSSFPALGATFSSVNLL